MTEWFKNIKLSNKIYILIVVNTIMLIIIWFFIYFLLTGFQDKNLNYIKNEWDQHLEDTSTRKDYLIKIKSRLEYDGMIHNFKNYILQDSKNLIEIQTK
ncbi:MAG: hypothetical protein OEV44_03660 [Spirochaetota bacterium]|nr:hypothetical protein [Spirochaetota bacterium]